MKRFKINMTAMQWGLIAVDLGQVKNPSDSTQALASLIRVVLEGDDIRDLPFNVELVEGS